MSMFTAYDNTRFFIRKPVNLVRDCMFLHFCFAAEMFLIFMSQTVKRVQLRFDFFQKFFYTNTAM